MFKLYSLYLCMISYVYMTFLCFVYVLYGFPIFLFLFTVYWNSKTEEIRKFGNSIRTGWPCEPLFYCIVIGVQCSLWLVPNSPKRHLGTQKATPKIPCPPECSKIKVQITYTKQRLLSMQGPGPRPWALWKIGIWARSYEIT